MNKIIVSIVFAVILIMGISKIADSIYYVKKPEKSAYQVETLVADTSTTTQTVSASSESGNIMALFASTSSADGKKVFKKCAACHSINQGGKNKIGPKLWNVMFRPVGSITDYKYSKALSDYKKDWDWEEMNGFLIKPSTWIKGNKMGFAGLKDEKDRASVILYLNQNSDNPKTLP